MSRGLALLLGPARTMALVGAGLVAAAAAAAAAAEEPVFRPASLAFADLEDDTRFAAEGALQSLVLALSDAGLVAVHGIPGFGELRREAFLTAQACALAAPAAQRTAFLDGTERRSLGAEILASKEGPLEHGGKGQEACAALDAAFPAFRRLVSRVSRVLTKRLGDAFPTQPGAALLTTEGAASRFDTMLSLVDNGQQLEHFHSYRSASAPDNAAASASKRRPTIDLHTDQGFLIAFAPALFVEDTKANEPIPSASTGPAGNFHLELVDGSQVTVDFGPAADSLVFLLGDGAEQYINPQLLSGPRLRVPRHAFTMPLEAAGPRSRVWYGRMFLPPPEAVSKEHGLTFGRLRELMIDGSLQGRRLDRASEADGLGPTALELGCSKRQLAAEISGGACAANQIYCWHRCYDFTESVSPTACAAKGSGFNCTDQFDQIYRLENGHGDYTPKCTNSTSFVTPPPSVAQPAANATCTAWAGLASDSNFTFRTELVSGETVLLWSPAGEQVQFRMLHKGAVGWLGFAVENVGGGLKGMLGSSVVMGLNDLQLGISVLEYRINDTQSAWRHWKTPFTPAAIEAASMTVAGCVSYMDFRTKSISGRQLNVTSGTNRLIWALSRAAYVTMDFGGYAPYHSGASPSDDRTRFRGHVELNLATGAVVTAATPSTTTSKPGDMAGPTSGAPRGASLTTVVLLCFATLTLLVRHLSAQ